MTLQDVQSLSALANGRILARATVLEVDKKRRRLLAWWHQVNGPFHHEDNMVQLSFTRFRVLPGRIHVQARPALIVEAKDGLLASLILDADVVRGEFGETVFAAPCQSTEQTLCGGVNGVKGCGPQVAQ